MARDFGGDIYDLGLLTDDEIRELVVERLREYPTLDAGWIDVDVREGRVTLTGRVGTDGEVQVAEAVIHDVIGIEDYSNELVVDATHRGETPIAADADAARGDAVEDPLGDVGAQQMDEAEHLVADLSAETYGTRDMGKAIRDGASYQPPDGPIPDGYGSREDH